MKVRNPNIRKVKNKRQTKVQGKTTENYKTENKPEKHEEQISSMEHKRTGEQAEEHRRRMDKSRMTTGQKQNYIFYELNITMLQSYQQVDIKCVEYNTLSECVSNMM